MSTSRSFATNVFRLQSGSLPHPHRLVVFSHETALSIARQTREHRIPTRTAEVSLPERALSETDAKLVVRLLAASDPSFHLRSPLHYLLSGVSRGRVTQLRFPHMHRGDVPRRSIMSLGGGFYFAAPEFAITFMAARCESEAQLLLLLWEACGTYQTHSTATHRAFDVEPLASIKTLGRFCDRNPSLPGSRKVRRMLRYVANGSASVRETQLALLLGLPVSRGGYGLGIPCMNYRVEATAEAYAIASRRSFRCDLCWPEVKLDVEYQSREGHEGEVMRVKDSRRANALASMGWTVLGVTNGEVTSRASTDTIAETVRRALGKRRRLLSDEAFRKRMKLRRDLGLVRYARDAFEF